MNSKNTDSKATAIPATGNQAKQAIEAVAPATIPRPDDLATAAGLAAFVAARVSYLEQHPTSRKDKINSSVARALNSRKAAPPVGMPFWTGPDVAALRARTK